MNPVTTKVKFKEKYISSNIIHIDKVGNLVDGKYEPDDFEQFVSYENNLSNMKCKIAKHCEDIWCPNLNHKCNKKVQTNSWFTIRESISVKTDEHKKTYILDPKQNVNYKCIKISLRLSKKQKRIINGWLNAYIDMYNIALKYIKENIKKDKNVINHMYLRDKLMKEKKNIINGFSNVNFGNSKKNISIKIHDIDYAIKLACSNWKSAITNLKNGNIKQFRIRYWKKNKSIKIMDLEKNDFQSGSIRKNVLGIISGTYNGKPFKFDKIDCDCKLRREGNEYTLYVPEIIDDKGDNDDVKKNQISIDMGLRTFITGITNNKIVEIGDECAKIIKEYLNRKDKILDNDEISDKIKKKNELMINKKIKNLVTDMHWKVIKYLTDNYQNIFIGDISAKGIVKKNGALSNMQKRVVHCLSFYKFKERFIYKCNVNKNNYKLVNEWMTSKMCSKCGTIKYDLGGSKKYNCEYCGLKIDRDVNASRNIHIKCIKTSKKIKTKK